ncbi:MAG: malto-oligosyltrehalose synthase [Acidimicrobiales bacterium]
MSLLPPPEALVAPRATYRVQLHAGFTFDDAAAIVPYLARIGVSHLYCSPVLQAAPGSTHGYDVVDHQRLNDELGGPSGWERLVRALAEHDLSAVLDIVPNHMALAGAANRWWWDVLENGPASRYAAYFDIDWEAGPSAQAPSVLAPVLGDHYGRVLEAGGFRLRRAGGAFTVRYEDHELPLSLPSVGGILQRAGRRSGSAELEVVAKELLELSAPAGAPAGLVMEEVLAPLRLAVRRLAARSAEVAEAIDEELAATEGDLDELDALLSQQVYRLAHWRTASEELDYRRFFDVSTLVGLRAEDPDVFEDTHRLVLDLVSGGDVTGLRVDHVDGLRDPERYLERLAAEAPGAGIVVEKILGTDEELPRSWPVAGTSGYDFLVRAGDLFIDPDGLSELRTSFAALTGDERPVAEIAADAKAHVMGHELAAETERLTDLLQRLCRARRRHRDHTRRDLREALTALAAALPVYRTYVAPGRPTRPEDRRRLDDAVAAVRASRPDMDGELLDLLHRILTLDEPGTLEQELAVRFQQLSSPVMAKGVEDTTFYRYVPLLAVNEVGGDPAAAGGGVAPFHAHNEHIATTWPRTMLAVSTHDTKRSADVRARLSVLTELSSEWLEAVEAWRAHNHGSAGAAPDPATELVFYQSLVGAWPIDGERLEATMLKSIREAKVHTSWRQPDEGYEDAVLGFVRGALADGAFLEMVERFLTEHDLVRLGHLTSLAQVALLLTCPGVPDLYQGDELWALSLVDPDNRRPVDFERRRTLLDQLDRSPAGLALPSPEGGAKLWLIHRLLDHRRRRPDAYSGYEALPARGPQARHAVAFRRDGIVVVVPRLVRALARSGWGETAITLPSGAWTSVLDDDGSAQVGEVAVADLLGALPVTVLERQRR